jgi:DNA-binding NarL/FixJ family response regulator
MLTERKKMILCIGEVKETAAKIAEKLIERGFAVSIAHDGQEGLAAIRRETPDLVLCDISIPVTSGFDMIERLKEAACLGGVPFVFLTAPTERENELKARRLGADNFITRPLDFDVLASIIDARQVHAAPRPKPVDLNKQEVATLTLAARGRTSVQIAKDLGLTKRTVDFHIDNARRKLGAKTRLHAVIKARDGHLIKP